MDNNLLIFINVLLIIFNLHKVWTNVLKVDNELTPILTITDYNGFLVKNINVDYIDIPIHLTLRLRCDGKEPIIWHSSEYDLVIIFLPFFKSNMQIILIQMSQLNSIL